MTASITFHQPQEPKRRSRSHIDTPERHQRGKELARELEVTSVREEKKGAPVYPTLQYHRIVASKTIMNPPPGAYQGIHQKQESFVRRQSNVADPSAGDVTDADKRTIYQHPLFPLLLMLFEKCELATQTTECPSARSIDSDIRLFITQMQTTGKSLLAESDDVDSLVSFAVVWATRSMGGRLRGRGFFLRMLLPRAKACFSNENSFFCTVSLPGCTHRSSPPRRARAGCGTL